MNNNPRVLVPRTLVEAALGSMEAELAHMRDALLANGTGTPRNQRRYAELETQYNALRQIFDREPTQNIEELRHNAAGILDHIDDPTATIAAFRGGEGEE